MKPNPKTYILHLTVEEFIQVIQDNIRLPQTTATAVPATPPVEGPTFTGRILYGVVGIERFFSISHKTACEWKKTWLKPAIKQNGRKILTDAEYALKLYDQKHAQK